MVVAITDEIWAQEYATNAGGVTFPGRMTIVRLPGDELALMSPSPIDATLKPRLGELGRVAHIVAPNLFHHLHLAAAAAAYPEASLYGPKGIEAKLPEIDASSLRDPIELASMSDGDIRAIPIEGVPQMTETVFLHVPSKSLIVTDLVFHIRQPRGLVSHLAFMLAGTYKRFAHSRLWKMGTKDKEQLQKSVQSLLAWEFERVIMAHGEVVESDAHGRLSKVLPG